MDWWQYEKGKENIIKKKYLPEKILFESRSCDQVDDEGEKAYCISQTGLDCTSKTLLVKRGLVRRRLAKRGLVKFLNVARHQ